MHFHFPFTVVQTLWTLTFAAQLVLLVVLLGCDRIQRYPWFTASIGLFALRLLAEVLLSGRMAMMPLQTTLLALGDAGAIAALLVVLEMAWSAFSGAKRWHWLAWALPMAIVALWAMAVWGPWPAWKDLAVDTVLGKLRLMQLTAQKLELLSDLLMVEVGLLIVLHGSDFKAGWRSHTQKISLGLSTAALSTLAVQGTIQAIARAAQAHPPSRPDYERIIALIGKLIDANKVVYIVVLLWWIVWLWLDEPGTAKRDGEAPESPAKDEPATAE